VTIERDARLIYAAGFIRSATVSLAGVLLAIHLGRVGFSATTIGIVIGVGLAGASLVTIAVSVRGDRWGRKRVLMVVAVLTAIGYVAVATAADAAALFALAFIGLLNGMGRDRGPASALDQAILPQTVPAERRTWVLAWYNVVIDSGHAVGALGASIPMLLMRHASMASLSAHRITFLLCAALTLAALLPLAVLTPRIEVEDADSRPPSLPDARSRAVIARLALLFGLDSIGGGFLGSALVAYWFFQRYGASEGDLALLFFAARVLNAASHVAAAWLARRIGLLNTMVFTHLPSSLFLLAAPAAPTFGIAAALFLAREGLVEMDVPTRQSYVMAVVKPHERTFASGVTNVTRNAAWAVGPSVAGALMQHVALAGPLFIGGTLKIAYDLLLYRSFRHVAPPEEQKVL
jgi:MFS family permease